MDARFALNSGLYSPATIAAPDPEQLIRMNFGLVRKIAWHTHGRVSSAIDIEELMQIGMIALIEAARAFEDRGQAAFTTYASVRVRGAMIDALRKQATLCRSALRKRRELNAARSELVAKLGHPPSEVELARHLDLPLSELHEQISATQELRHESMDEVYSEHSIWFASEEPDALEQLQSADMKRALVEAIANLPEGNGAATLFRRRIESGGNRRSTWRRRRPHLPDQEIGAGKSAKNAWRLGGMKRARIHAARRRSSRSIATSDAPLLSAISRAATRLHAPAIRM